MDLALALPDMALPPSLFGKLQRQNLLHVTNESIESYWFVESSPPVIDKDISLN
jgi:hypothetical protein